MVTPFITILRPSQWLKNLMLFFPLFLGGGLLQPGIIMKGVLPFAAFCLASSATYIFNDLRDRKQDSLHPTKKMRPLASGKMGVKTAQLYWCLVLAGSFLLASFTGGGFLPYLLFYLAISSSYSLWLKNVPVADMFCISAGFLLRLEAGGSVFNVVVSEWLFLSVFLLSLFLSAGKRLGEKIALGAESSDHRFALRAYPDHFLSGCMFMAGSAVLVTYSMYVISRPNLIYSVPLCAYGLFRYVFRVKQGESGDPTTSLLKDVHLLTISILWASYFFWALYLD